MSGGRHALRAAAPMSTADPRHPIWRPIRKPAWWAVYLVVVVYLVLGVLLLLLVVQPPPAAPAWVPPPTTYGVPLPSGGCCAQ